MRDEQPKKSVIIGLRTSLAQRESFCLLRVRRIKRKIIFCANLMEMRVFRPTNLPKNLITCITVGKPNLQKNLGHGKLIAAHYGFQFISIAERTKSLDHQESIEKRSKFFNSTSTILHFALTDC